MTIRDIAKIVGVSNATVSRAINGTGYVKAETKEKIEAVIAQYSYVPNAVARSLSTNNSRTIGVIIPDIENEFFNKVVNGISEVAGESNYNILYFGTNETLHKEHQYLDIFLEQRLLGLIITPISEQDTVTRSYLQQLRRQNIPVVLVDRDIAEDCLDGVFTDNFNGAYAGVEAFIQAGHRAIATICGPDDSFPGRERLEGFYRAMADYHIPVPQEYVEQGNFRIAKAYQCTERLLSLPHPPTAIFAANNLSTLGCLKYLTQKKIQLGRDISLLGFDNIEALDMIDYPLSFIHRDAIDQGRQAMQLLLQKLKQTEPTPPQRIITPYRLVLKGSERLGKIEPDSDYCGTHSPSITSSFEVIAHGKKSAGTERRNQNL